MAANPKAMSDETFYGYMYPLQNRRYYLALVFSILLFPLIAVGLIAGTVVLIVPLIAFFLWFGMRVFFAYLLGNSILVSAENYPRIHTITEEIKQRLGYSKRIYVFVYESSSFNAYMRHIFFRRAIFLNSELLQTGVSDHEARWMVGRFVGYMRARQQAGVLGWLVRAAQSLGIFNFFILPYERAMVYTGDRLALAEIDGDLASAISVMQKLLVGRELGYSVNPEGLIVQHREVKGSLFGFMARVGTGFPHTTARYVDLILFAKAFFPEQFKIFEAANPGLPADLDQLGISQQTDSGAPRAAHAPKGWAWAGATAATMVILGVLAWKTLTPGTTYTDFFEPTSPAPVAADGVVVQPPPSAQEVVVQPSLPAVTADATPDLPPNTHFDPATKLVEPNAGCRWLTDDEKDLRVVCQ